MEHLVTAARQAMADRNWYAALTLALTMPDICGRLSDENAGTPQALNSGPRYIGWCRQYLEPTYTRPVGADQRQHVFLSAEDTYALRCALLHEGSDSIVDQRARVALSRFRFVADSAGRGMPHCNQINSALQLDVQQFCQDVCDAVDRWLHDSRINPSRQQRIAALMTIEIIEDGGVSWSAHDL